MINRRKFLRNLSLTSAALTAPAVFVHSAETYNKGKRKFANRTLQGQVHSNGVGVAGVAVTDGFLVATTDKNGNYQLLSNSAAEFVYISIPSGYAFANENGIAKFYMPIAQKSATFKADFSLEKLEADDRKHNFIVWADPQIISEKDADILKKESAPDLRDLVNSYPKGTLFHGIGCGDLVWDHFELFEDYRQAVAISGIPFFNVIGNHDMDLDARTDDYSAKTFKQQFGPTYYSFNRGEIHYIVLDDVFFLGAAKQYIGYLTENQLQWLEQDLALVKPGTTVIVNLHIPTNTGAARRNKKEEELGGTVSNRKQLYKMLAPYKAHIMSGHAHVTESWEEGTIMEHNHGAVCGAWWTGPICSDGTPNGYGVYEVNGSELKWYYKSVGKPKEHQLRLYARGRIKDAADEIAANVWNWDAQWKVEWFEDGINKGIMERRVAFDPWAVELFEGPELPQKHKFVEPALTDHLFFAKPSPNAKEITVKATDRFGNVYQEQIVNNKAAI